MQPIRATYERHADMREGRRGTIGPWRRRARRVRTARSGRCAATLLVGLVLSLLGGRLVAAALRRAPTLAAVSAPSAPITLATPDAGVGQPFVDGSGGAAELAVDETVRSARRVTRARSWTEPASSFEVQAERARSRAHAALLAFLTIRPELTRAITGGLPCLGTTRPPPPA